VDAMTPPVPPTGGPDEGRAAETEARQAHPEVVCAALPALSMAAVAAWVVTGTTPVDTAGWVVALVTGWAR